MTERVIEIIDSPDSPAKQSHSVKESGFLNRIASVCKWLRLGVAALGLLAAPQAGCAHAPKQVPNSVVQPNRQICIAWAASKDGDIVVNNFGSIQTVGEYVNVRVRELLSAELEKYFSERFTNIEVRDLGFQRVGRLSLYDSRDYGDMPFEEYIRDRTQFFIGQGCDDIVGIELKAAIYRKKQYGDGKGTNVGHDTASITARATVINMERSVVVNDERGSISHREERETHCISFLDPDHCGKPTPVEVLFTDPLGIKDEVDDLFEDTLLLNYHPEQLPALSLTKIIDALYSRVAGTDEPLDDEKLQHLSELCQLFLSRTPDNSHADKVKSILEDIQSRPARYQERLRREQERVQREQETARVARELQNSVEAAILIAEIQAAREANRQLRYDDRNMYYFRALNAWRALQREYRRANISMPDNLVRLGRETEVTCAMISRPDDGPPGPGDTITGILGDMIRGTVRSLPRIVEGIFAVADSFELSEEKKAELRRQGMTAELRLEIVEVDWLARIPQENIEVTLRNLDSNDHQTYRTSKEGVIQAGGVVSFFFLRPGFYEITSPVMKKPLRIKINDGRNVVDIDLH